MAKHLYLVADCRNSRCANICVFRYMGNDDDDDDDDDDDNIEQLNTNPLQVRYTCGLCHQRHDYEIMNMRMEFLGVPPPSDWRNRW
jgi:hypothetical protein